MMLERKICDANELYLAATRARAAVPHLEFALQAGYKSAAKPLMDAHLELAKLYKAQHKQFKEMKSIYLSVKQEKVPVIVARGLPST